MRLNWDLAVVIAVSLAVYQPWNNHLLSPGDPVAGISSVSATQWYWTLFNLNAFVLLAARELFSKSGSGRVATAICLSLWATMSATAMSFVSISRESFALLFLIAAMLAAWNYADAANWRGRTAAIAVGAAAIVLAKPALVVLLPALWLTSRLRVGEHWEWARLSRRDAFLGVAMFLAIAIAFIVVLYSGQYERELDTLRFTAAKHPLSEALHRLEAIVIPAGPRLHRLINLIVDPGFTFLFVLPNILWLRLIAGGVIAGKRRTAWPLGISMIWIAAGLLLYVGSSAASKVSMLPFAFGAMFGSAHALTALTRSGQARTYGVICGAALVLAACAVEGRSVVQSRELRARLYAGVIDAVAAKAQVTRFIGATPEPESGNRSWGLSMASLGRAYPHFNGVPASDLDCASAKRVLESEPATVVVSTGWGCGKLSPRSIEIRATVPRHQWPWLWERYEIESRMYVDGGVGHS